MFWAQAVSPPVVQDGSTVEAGWMTMDDDARSEYLVAALVDVLWKERSCPVSVRT